MLQLICLKSIEMRTPTAWENFFILRLCFSFLRLNAFFPGYKGSSALSLFLKFGLSLFAFSPDQMNKNEQTPPAGEVVLDKLPRVRTVLHKASKIDTDFRTFSVDLMAGEPDYLTTVKENNASFKLDFSKVYWNPRLGNG
ncbi:unnamed protein product [Schistocephalus solidus]|uniref:tRNA wybutosine-synthesizing protein 2 homolog n=1 Tax=Schistocephalus solidus TaxID=70667 RepID=A0A183SCN9_SCHSO|nr:unnamed protein product [Schistocephalus solidus]